MADRPDYFIGLMSGTSADAIDAVLLTIENNTPNTIQIISAHTQHIPDSLKQKIVKLSFPGQDSIELYGNVDRETAFLFAETANQLLALCQLERSDIKAIGSHGQTIRHQPENSDSSKRFTIQIGCPSTIAALTGITTIADFRRKDIALGGQAAPLVPAFHRAVFQHPSLNRAIVNIGGIANITWVPCSTSDEDVLGFDTGPGNCLMDGWILNHQNRPFDDQGQWAKQGKYHQALLDQLLEQKYFHQPWPKSTGKELFNQQWLETQLEHFHQGISPEDVQATLCQLTVKTIALGLRQLPKPANEILVCGGGVNNTFLMASLAQAYKDAEIKSVEHAGMHPMHVEAAAFGWLAHQTINKLPGSIASVTGASRDSILGGVYYPN